MLENDLVGVGAGLTNLSLAALIETARARFFERNQGLSRARDDLLWDVVAFVRKLPELTPEQYENLVKNAPKHEELMQEMEMGGEHQHNGEHQ